MKQFEVLDDSCGWGGKMWRKGELLTVTPDANPLTTDPVTRLQCTEEVIGVLLRKGAVREKVEEKVEEKAEEVVRGTPDKRNDLAR